MVKLSCDRADVAVLHEGLHDALIRDTLEVQRGGVQELEVDLSLGEIRNLTTGQTFSANPYPDFMIDIMEAGGLMSKTVRDLKR